jgi:hypothetical protein
MPEAVGKVEKPLVEKFKGRRKLYFVPLIYSGKDAPDDYREKFERYWEEAESHINNLEAKMGRIRKVYHEAIFVPGDEGMKLIEKMNSKSYQIVKSKMEKGAELQATEDKDLATESTDWERCLMIGIMNEKVAERISEFYLEASRKRYEHIAKRIDETLKEGETGLLFIKENHWVQFPSTIEVFNVYPPALDEIDRWFRDQSQKLFDQMGRTRS